ncbi:hypothetical protein [Chthonobacter albigriseus]|uniref:hypothetical protein n=1 Tax=Chthonobacter albigriseus TaxID=1683161 RepID=UPI0015EFB373|nr:hypothetical protein [Chthonobacter albigriseus]
MRSAAGIAAAAAAPARRAGWLWPLLLAAEIAAFLALACTAPPIPDAAWLLTVAERFLDGARLAVDIVEVNPPMSVYLSVPVVALARLLGMAPDTLLPFYTGLAILSGIVAAGRILHRAGLVDTPSAWNAMAFAAIALAPIGLTAEREQFAVALMLPGLALLMAGMAGSPLIAGRRFAIGIATGLGACIKPHFALAVLLAALASAVRTRDVRPLFALEHWTAAAVLALYAGVVMVFHPAYLDDLLPVLAEVYLPLGAGPLRVLATEAGVATVLIAVGSVMAWRRRIGEPMPLVLHAAALGFFTAFLLQGKGWAYQAIPAVALLLIALAWGLRTRAADAIASPLLPAAGVIAAATGFAPAADDFLARFDAAERYGTVIWQLRGASVATISGDIALGHPVVRLIDGRWVQRAAYRFIALGARHELMETPPPDRAARLEALIDADRADLRTELAAERPDVILAHRAYFDWLAWAREDAALAAVLGGYRTVERVDLADTGLGIVDILVRGDLAAARALPAVVASDPAD